MCISAAAADRPASTRRTTSRSCSGGTVTWRTPRRRPSCPTGATVSRRPTEVYRQVCTVAGEVRRLLLLCSSCSGTSSAIPDRQEPDLLYSFLCLFKFISFHPFTGCCSSCSLQDRVHKASPRGLGGMVKTPAQRGWPSGTRTRSRCGLCTVVPILPLQHYLGRRAVTIAYVVASVEVLPRYPAREWRPRDRSDPLTFSGAASDSSVHFSTLSFFLFL